MGRWGRYVVTLVYVVSILDLLSHFFKRIVFSLDLVLILEKLRG